MENYMLEAIKEAKIAAEMSEIPVGAVIVKDGEIIARGHNTTDTDGDPTAHAEINAIRQAGGRGSNISTSASWIPRPEAADPCST